MTVPCDWNPDQYERFRAERSQPFFDLLDLVERRPGMRVVDLGCGTGDMTAVLHERLGARETIGIDSSPAMLARSGAHAAPGLRFELGDLATFTGREDFDLVFANAALHWVSEHEAVLGRLTAVLRPGGQIAVQVPANHTHLSHLVADEVASEHPFAEAVGGYTRGKPVLEPEEYAAVIHRLGFERQHVRLQVYGHLLASREEVIEWVRGTLLTEYQKRLAPDMYARFLVRYGERLLPRLEDARPYFYPYRRILFWGRLPR